MKTTNQQLMNEIYFNIPILSETITNGFNKYYYYLDILKDEKYVEIQNETEDEAIRRAESVYGRLDEMLERNDLSNKKASETIEILNKMTELFGGIVKNTEIEKRKLTIRNNELLDKIINLEERKTNKLIEQNPTKKNLLNADFEDKKEEWNEHRIKTKETLPNKIIEPISTSLLNDLNNEMKQLEEWSGMKIGNIIFDSNIDNWNKGTSVFGQKILKKGNLIFLIEDGDGNLFGGYVNAKIFGIGWIKDPKSFVFSLKSNGRLNQMMKFDIKQDKSQYAFYLFNQPHDYLFLIGYDGIGIGDICIQKEHNKNKSSCRQHSFNYDEIQNALCGKSYPQTFTPKRITIIQLI